MNTKPEIRLMPSALSSLEVLQSDTRHSGEPNECFYCQQPVGQLHAALCVSVTKTVEVCFSFEGTSQTVSVAEIVPYYWDDDSTQRFFRDSSWCASNLLADVSAQDAEWLRALIPEDVCLCSVHADCKVVRVIDPGPHRRT